MKSEVEVIVSLTTEMRDRLFAYCESHNITLSEAAEKALEYATLKYENSEKNFALSS